MADWHVLTADERRITVAMHFIVPSGTNLAGLTWAQAVASDPDRVRTSAVPNLSTAHADQIADGTVVEEVVRVFKFPRFPSEGRAPIDDAWSAAQPRVTAQVRSRYRGFGLSGNVGG